MNKPKVTEVSPTLFKVLSHSVKIQTKKGRKIIICDCINDTRFCNESPICFHKQLVLEYIFTKKLRERLDKLIPLYENWTRLRLPQNPELMLQDLKSLRKVL